jgi:hypothetical protein
VRQRGLGEPDRVRFVDAVLRAAAGRGKEDDERGCEAAHPRIVTEGGGLRGEAAAALPQRRELVLWKRWDLSVQHLLRDAIDGALDGDVKRELSVSHAALPPRELGFRRRQRLHPRVEVAARRLRLVLVALGRRVLRLDPPFEMGS